METNGMMKALEALAERGIKINEGDYIGDDGLLYCGKCHTRKQVRLKQPDGTEITPMCLCQCEVAARDAEEAEQKRLDQMYRINDYKRAGFPDKELRNCTFAHDDSNESMASRAAHNYVEHFAEFRKAGKGLMFYGNVGTGKTFLAACIANALIDELHPCLVTNFSRIINTLQGMYDGKQQYIDSLNRYELLVIDDLAAERNTEYVNEIVYNVIDSRYRSGKPLIVTTNISPEEMKSETDINRNRVYSRIGEMCMPIKVAGEDRRQKKQDGELLRLLYE